MPCAGNHNALRYLVDYDVVTEDIFDIYYSIIISDF